MNFIFADIFPTLFVFARLGPAISLIPGIGEGFVSKPIRLYISLMLSLVLSFPLKDVIPPIPPTDILLGLLLAKELCIGFFIGTLIRLLFYTLEMAGALISFQIGLSAATAFNPSFGGQSSIVSSFFAITAIALIFVTDLHIFIFENIILSYKLFPALDDLPVTDFASGMVLFVNNSFYQAVQLSIPTMVVIMIFYLSVGLLSKFIPQVQIFFVSLPAQVMLGVLILAMTLSGILTAYYQYFTDSLLALGSGGLHG